MLLVRLIIKNIELSNFTTVQIFSCVSVLTNKYYTTCMLINLDYLQSVPNENHNLRISLIIKLLLHSYSSLSFGLQ